MLSNRFQFLPALGLTLLLSLPATTILSGCSGGSGGPTVPVNPAGANLTLSTVSGDFNGISSPLQGGTATFTRRKTDTTDGIDATVKVGSNPERAVMITISTAGAISVGQRFQIGVSDDFRSSTDVSYTESRTDQSQLWATEGGPGVSGNGSVTVVALSETSVSLRVENANLSRRDDNGPPAAGSFTLNGDVIVRPN